MHIVLTFAIPSTSSVVFHLLAVRHCLCQSSSLSPLPLQSASLSWQFDIGSVCQKVVFAILSTSAVGFPLLAVQHCLCQTVVFAIPFTSSVGFSLRAVRHCLCLSNSRLRHPLYIFRRLPFPGSSTLPLSFKQSFSLSSLPLQLASISWQFDIASVKQSSSLMSFKCLFKFWKCSAISNSWIMLYLNLNGPHQLVA